MEPPFLALTIRESDKYLIAIVPITVLESVSHIDACLFLTRVNDKISSIA